MKKASAAMSLVDYCVKDSILCNMEVGDKEDALDQLIHALWAAKAIPKSKLRAIRGEVIERERQATTGIGNGIGVPHARSGQVRKILLAIGSVPEGVDFGAVDGERVRVILLLISPTKQHEEHLAAMRSIVKIARDPYQCKRLHGCCTPASFVDLLAELSS